MKCALHAEVDAAGYCRNCGKALCATCVRPVRDVLYCEDCLAIELGHAAPPVVAGAPGVAPSSSTPPVVTPRAVNNPVIAFILGFLFPGLGAVYNGEYNKALVQILIFASMIFGLSSDMDDSFKPVLAILLAGFIFYMAFDAMRVAKAKNVGEIPPDPMGSWIKDRPVGPIVLIVVGALFLLNNFDWFPWYRVHQFWPLVLIVAGVFLFRNRLGRRS